MLGPGLITGASDDDPSGIGTYSQVGSQFGYGLLWLALFTFPLMGAVQELCARIALQTGVRLGASLRRKFPRWLVGIAILGLLGDNAAALAPLAGPFAFSVFSVGLIGAGLLAIPILTGSATYAVKEFFGFGGSLASKPQNRPTFYLILTLATVAGVVMNFVHLDPIRALFIAAVINGVLAPPLLF